MLVFPVSFSNLGITSSKLIKIFRMPNPERGQKTLEFPSTSAGDEENE